MKRFLCIFLALFLCLFCIQPPLQASAANTILRVGLYYGSSALPSASLTCAEGFDLGTISGTAFSKKASVQNSAITIKGKGSTFSVQDPSGKVIYSADGDHLAIHARGQTTTLKDNSYRGDFLVRANSSGALTIINYVDLEDYVKGVLPYEMSASWPIEALKAQALCARSYALGNRNKHKSSGFDLCNTTNCQVYRGVGRSNANSDAAVDQTAGQLLMANGKLAVGYFFASDGGATENNENVWGGDPISYLRGVKDPYEDASMLSKHNWSVTMTPDQITSKLKSAGYSIGPVSDVKITKRTALDNVNEVTVTDTAGKTITIRREAVRTAFGFNSMRYHISNGGTSSGGLYINGTQQTNRTYYAIGGNKKSSSIGSVSGKTALTASGKQTISLSSGTAAPPGSFTFTGTGWGHSVGLSQYGARSMALKGFSYDQILKFYYTGIAISGT